jgi:hypothetical protein
MKSEIESDELSPFTPEELEALLAMSKSKNRDDIDLLDEYIKSRVKVYNADNWGTFPQFLYEVYYTNKNPFDRRLPVMRYLRQVNHKLWRAIYA